MQKCRNACFLLGLQAFAMDSERRRAAQKCLFSIGFTSISCWPCPPTPRCGKCLKCLFSIGFTSIFMCILRVFEQPEMLDFDWFYKHLWEMRISCRQLRNAWFLLVLQAFANSPCPPVSAVSECLFSITFTSIPSISHSAHAKSGNACNGNGFQAFSGVFGAVRRMWQMLVLVTVFKYIYKLLGPAPACQNAWFRFTLQAFARNRGATLCGP